MLGLVELEAYAEQLAFIKTASSGVLRCGLCVVKYVHSSGCVANGMNMLKV